MFSSRMLLRTCLLRIRFHYPRGHDAIWELLQMTLAWRLQRQTPVAVGLCLVLPDTWTPLWQILLYWHCRKLRSNIISPCQQLFLQCWDLLVVWRLIVRIVHGLPCRAGWMASCTLDSQHWDAWEQKWCKGFSTSITSSSHWPLAASSWQVR